MELKKLTKTAAPKFPCILIRILRGKFADVRFIGGEGSWNWATRGSRYYTHYCDEVPEVK